MGKAKKLAKKTRCNVKLNTRKGMRRGRCGPKFKKTTCASGNCSRWGWCGYSRLHKWRRSWKNKYDRTRANKACFARFTKKTIKRVVRAIKKSKAKFLKRAKKAVSKSKDAKKLKKLIKKSKAKKVNFKKITKKIQKKATKAKKAKKLAKKTRCNVKLNTRKGMRRGRCGPKFKK